MNWLERSAVARPDALAVKFTAGGEWTYGEMVERVSKTAAALQSTGVGPGSRVATLLANSPMQVLVIHAVAWLGATLVPVNTRLVDAEVSWLLRDVQADLLVLDEAAVDRSLDLGSTRFVQVEGLTRSLSVESRKQRPESVATILYTSGTTGLPKPVPLTWANHAASASASAMNLGVCPDDNWLCCLPLYHIGGLSIVYRSMLYGTAFTLTEGFEINEVAEAMLNDATLVSLVPTMLRRLWERGPDLFSACRDSRLRGILLGGAPADRETLKRCADAELPVYQTYGLTEACSQVTTMPPGRALEKTGSSGLPIFGAEVEIRCQDGSRCKAGKEGTIFVRGPMVTSGYLERAAENDRRFRQAWFDTADWGRLDEDGFLWVVSRRNDLIVTGGENVYPVEVESVLLEHPAVAEVAVFGIDDPEWGQRVAAAIVEVEPIDDETLVKFCRTRLAGFKIPRIWHRLEELPRTASGKIKRMEVADAVLGVRP